MGLPDDFQAAIVPRPYFDEIKRRRSVAADARILVRGMITRLLHVDADLERFAESDMVALDSVYLDVSSAMDWPSLQRLAAEHDELRDFIERLYKRAALPRKQAPVTEGRVKRHGSNPTPTTTKPDFSPPGQGVLPRKQ